jgi:hypothetical protein
VEDTICRLYRLAIYALQLEIQLSRGKGWDLRYIDINKLLMLHFPVKGKYQSQTAYGFETHKKFESVDKRPLLLGSKYNME